MAMRRAPRIWEQKLEKMIRSAGVAGLGAASSAVIGPPPVPGPDAGGSEPAPPPVVDPAPETPRVPSTPVVAGTTLGLTVIWDGKDTSGVFFPRGTTVEVYISGTTGFTPSSATLKGVITEPGGSLLVGGISAGATFYVRFIAVYADGQKSDPSAEGSAMVGLVQGPDINGDAVITQIVAATTPVTTYKLGSIWINTSNGTYNVLQSVGGTPTWVKREWDTAAIAANAITANQIAAQAITAKLVSGEIIRTSTADSGARVRISSADGVQVFGPSGQVFQASPTGTVTITGYATSGDISNFITGSQVNSNVTSISGDAITTGTITGRLFRTAASGKRIEIQTAGTNNGQIEIYNSSNVKKGFIEGDASYILIGAPDGLGVKGNIFGGRKIGSEFSNPDAFIYWSGGVELGLSPAINAAFRISLAGAVFSYGIDEATTANAANVRVGASAQLLKSTSTVRLKDALTPIVDGLAGVESEKLADFPASIDPYDVLTLTPTEFSSLSPADAEARMFGFIAEDVAEKLPWAANWDEEGLPSAVEDRPILAALLFVVREQQEAISQLTARLEALEA